MAENGERLSRKTVLYYPYSSLCRVPGKGLLAPWPTGLRPRPMIPAFFFRMVAAAARRTPVRMEKVDSNGLLPCGPLLKSFHGFAFRRFLQKRLPDHLLELPKEDPLKGVKIQCLVNCLRRSENAGRRFLPRGSKTDPRGLPPSDRSRRRVAVQRGGSGKARQALRIFLDKRLPDYAESRNQPEVEVTSGLSPYLHFGHISVHEIFRKLIEKEGWFPDGFPTRPPVPAAGGGA